MITLFCPGELLLVQVARPHRVTTPLLEPSSEAVWGGRSLVAVASHTGGGSMASGGHWRTYVLHNSVWFLLDSLPVGGERPQQKNPFLDQEDYKIQILAFK